MLRDYDIIRAFFNACRDSDFEAIANFVKNKSIDLKQPIRNSKGHTPLHFACLNNNIKLAKFLIHNGADVNAANDGTTILHSAVGSGMYKMTALLLRAGAKVNVEDKNGLLPLHLVAQLPEERLDLFLLLYLSDAVSVNETHLKGMLSLYIGTAVNQQRLNVLLAKAVEVLSNQKSIKLVKRELVTFAPSEYCDFSKLKTLNLSNNYIKHFPKHIMLMISLQSLDLSYNKIEALPPKIPESLPHLKWFDISNNKIDVVPPDLTDIPHLDLWNNPLSSIPPMFREDKSKLLFYAKYGGKREPWNQVKVMLVGHEGVGKTTFLKSLQGQNTPATKNPNISTNGVDITTVELPCNFSESKFGSIFMPSKKKKIVCNVWDFGGQTVFHSTHRFFLTSSAIYVVVYNMADDQTHDRLQHWMQQIQSVVDMQGASMPILIVGTHADKLSSAEQEQVMSKITKLYPVSKKTTGVQGHFAVSLSSKSDNGLPDLKEAIIKIAKEHPKLGIGQVQVPSFLILIKEKLEQLKNEKKYLSWSEYKEICQEVVITPDFPVVEWTLILQELGVLVWNNTAQLKDIVIIHPQWLADALAGVVTMVNQGAIARAGGVALRSKLYSIMRNKIVEEALYPVIFGLLERFEIILRMRNYYSGLTKMLDKADNEEPEEEDYKYFVPSLLLAYNAKKDLAHPAMQFWKRLTNKSGFVMLKRRFTWTFYPANFFPRLLLRLMHMQVSLLGSWVDAAVLMSQDQGHYAFIHLFSHDGSFLLEVTVMQDKARPTDIRSVARDSLISELAYAITRLDRDMWEDKSVKHEVVVCLQSDPHASRLSVADLSEAIIDQYKGPHMLEVPILFADCMSEVAKGTTTLTVADQQVRLDFIAPDLSCCSEIHLQSLSDMVEIGQGGFGVVHKAIMNDIAVSSETGVQVAVKELKNADEEEEGAHSSVESARKIYEFQHEMLIMSKMKHPNLVQLFGVVKSPLSLVMEFVPCGDLHELLKDPDRSENLTFKWRLKMAIDIARGMNYLHKQTPPICHSDLRAPNIFVASLDDASDVVGKVADFGLAQQIFPFSVQILGNLVETAPETWGDEGLTKGAMYDERSDVFSYAIILWRLFCSTSLELTHTSSTGSNNSSIPSFSPSPSPRATFSYTTNPFTGSPSPTPRSGLSSSGNLPNSPNPAIRNPFAINIPSIRPHSPATPSPRSGSPATNLLPNYPSPRPDSPATNLPLNASTNLPLNTSTTNLPLNTSTTNLPLNASMNLPISSRPESPASNAPIHISTNSSPRSDSPATNAPSTNQPSPRPASPPATPSPRSDSHATNISTSPPGTPTSTPSSPMGRRPLGESTESLRRGDPYDHLRDRKGQGLNKWTLRNKIRQGERPLIPSDCEPEIAKLMEECWQFDPTLRPFFPLIVRRLISLYATKIGEDDSYIVQDSSDVNIVQPPPQLDEKIVNINTQTTLSVKNWNPRPQMGTSDQSTWSIVSIIFVNGEIWAGTNTGAVLLINPKKGKLEHIIPLQRTGRVSLLHAGRSCIWASCENDKICMINAQTRYKIVEIDNEFPITCMAISYHHAGPTTPVVWVADTRGFVSLWDLTTVQKYCRFRAVLGSNPPPVRSMSVMNEHMWMAVGAEVVAFETQTLQRVVQSTGSSRINSITCVPSTRQAWTCSKDGNIKLWSLQSKLNRYTNSREWTITHLKTIKNDTEVKFVQAITASFPPLSRGHVVTGDFNGKLTMWNSESLARPEEFPMPEESSKHTLQCALDVGEYGLWVGTMNTAYPLMRYHCNPFFQQATPTMGRQTTAVPISAEHSLL